MWIVFGSCLYAMYLGFQIRKTRTATGEEKKKLIQGKYNDRPLQTWLDRPSTDGIRFDRCLGSYLYQ